MGGFARIGNNEITVLVNDAAKGSDIDPQEAQKTSIPDGWAQGKHPESKKFDQFCQSRIILKGR